MRNRLAQCCLLGVALVLGRIASADDWDGTPKDPDGSIALAERFATMSQQSLRGEKTSPASWRESAALLTAATRLAPAEPRFARFLCDDYQQLRDIDMSIATIKTYRALKPGDETAQTQQIDLYLTRMQSADEKLKYCQSLLNIQMVPTEVRSFAAMRAAQVMLQQTRTPDAIKMLDNALALNALNGPALRLKYDLTQAAATPLERVGMLLALVRANPADPSVATRLGQQMADVGLLAESMWWFGYANNVYNATGQSSDPQFAQGVSSELVLSDRSDEAVKLLNEYLKAVPGDAGAWGLRLAIAKYAMEQNKDDKSFKDAYDTVARSAGIGMTNALVQIRHSLGVESATTQPIDSANDPVIPDLSGDVALVQKSSNADLGREYIDILTSLAWYELYFKHDAMSADPLIAVLGQLLNERDVALTRLRGLRELINGSADAAAVKLSAVQDRDAYAALGMIEINLNYPAKHDETVAAATKLMANYPSGVLGATLFEVVRILGVTVTPTAAAGAIKTTLDAFPQDYLQYLQQPTLFYLFRAEPLKSSVEFGEPILMRVTVQNIGNFPLSVGPAAGLHPDVWFDAFMRGQIEQGVPGAAFDRTGERLLLQPNQEMTTVVRVDNGNLNALLESNPSLTLTVNFTACSNPILYSSPDKTGPQARPGPGGYRIQSSGMVERPGVIISTPDARTKLIDRAIHGEPVDKIRAIQAMAVLSMQLKNTSGATAESLGVADDFLAKVKALESDPVVAVRSWAMFLAAMASKPDARSADIDAMAASADWQTRMLALEAAGSLSDHGAALAAKLAADTDATVKDFAVALGQVIASQPTTVPATQPSEGM